MEYFYWFLGLCIALVIVFLFDYFFCNVHSFKNKNKLIISKIAHCGLLIAVSVLIQFLSTFIFSFSRYLQFPFVNISLSFTGFLFGPFFGFLSGIVYDLVQTLFGMLKGTYHPAFTFINGCIGLIPGIFVVFVIKLPKFFIKYASYLLWTVMVIVFSFGVVYSALNFEILARNLGISQLIFLITYYLVMITFYLFIFILYFYNFKKKKLKNIILFNFIFLTFFCEMIFVSFALTPLILSQMYEIKYGIFLLIRIIISPLTFGIVALITFFIVCRLRNIITSDKFLFYVIRLQENKQLILMHKF